MPKGGYVIYGVAHQHTGGIGSTLYGQVILEFYLAVFNYVSKSIYKIEHGKESYLMIVTQKIWKWLIILPNSKSMISLWKTFLQYV